MPLIRASARVAITFLAVQAVATGATWACSCVPFDAGAVQSDEIAFVGDPMGTRRMLGCDRPGKSDFVTHRTRLEVVEDLQGTTVGEVIEVVHGVSDASCGIQFGDAATWTVIAYRFEGEWATSLCNVQPNP